MAETPPAQIQAAAHTPTTPLHGAAYDNSEVTAPRRSTRSGQRKTSRDILSTPEIPKSPRVTRSVTTPGSSRRGSQHSHADLTQIHSSQPSPKHKPSRRVQILSPSSPEFGPSIPQATTSSYSRHTLHPSSTTTMTEGMLPTPVKTPKKNPMPKVSTAAQALFQDQPVIGEEVSSPRRGRKAKRYNGFSLESFSADPLEGKRGIHIFTDSRDKIPQVDVSDSNPFIEPPSRADEPSSRKLAGTSKRRKISGETKKSLKDPQVEEALKNDDGMVYVFRGKKVFRRFDDAGEEEEVIDTEDLGLLEHTPNGTAAVTPLKTLTRKSIKPARLFQTEEQKRARELEKEEETATDIEDPEDVNSVEVPEPTPTVINGRSVAKSSKASSRSLRSGAKVTSTGADKVNESALEKTKDLPSKKGSPFDAWKRVKRGASSSAVTAAPKSRKRGADEAFEEEDAGGKKIAT